LLVDRVSEITD